jgi:hypothetical protein
MLKRVITFFNNEEDPLSTSILLSFRKKDNSLSLQITFRTFNCLIHEDIVEPLTQKTMQQFFNRAIERILKEGANNKAVYVHEMSLEITTDIPNMMVETPSVKFSLTKDVAQALADANKQWFVPLSHFLPEPEQTKFCIIS